MSGGGGAGVTALGGMGAADAEEMLGLPSVAGGTLGGMGAADAESMLGLPPVSTTATGDGGGSWFDASKLGGALKGAAGAAKDANTSQAQKAQIQMAQGRAGSPIDRASLSQLVQMLQQRTQSYYPTGGQVGAQPVQIPRTLGLLGF